MVTFAVIAMGEMGSAVARRLIERGARVVSSLGGRSVASIDRAKAAGVELLNDAQSIDQAAIELSFCDSNFWTTQACLLRR